MSLSQRWRAPDLLLATGSCLIPLSSPPPNLCLGHLGTRSLGEGPERVRDLGVIKGRSWARGTGEGGRCDSSLGPEPAHMREVPIGKENLEGHGVEGAGGTGDPGLGNWGRGEVIGRQKQGNEVSLGSEARSLGRGDINVDRDQVRGHPRAQEMKSLSRRWGTLNRALQLHMGGARKGPG